MKNKKKESNASKAPVVTAKTLTRKDTGFQLVEFRKRRKRSSAGVEKSCAKVASGARTSGVLVPTSYAAVP